jgi:hypothetical protein
MPDCSICLSYTTTIVEHENRVEAEHYMCGDCFDNFRQQLHLRMQCPICREPITSVSQSQTRQSNQPRQHQYQPINQRLQEKLNEINEVQEYLKTLCQEVSRELTDVQRNGIISNNDIINRSLKPISSGSGEYRDVINNPRVRMTRDPYNITPERVIYVLKQNGAAGYPNIISNMYSYIINLRDYYQDDISIEQHYKNGSKEVKYLLYYLYPELNFAKPDFWNN